MSPRDLFDSPFTARELEICTKMRRSLNDSANPYSEV